MTGPEHCIFGALIAHLGLHQRYGARATAVLVVASIAPDIDSLTLLAGRMAFYRHHRTAFHSAGGVFPLAMLLAGLCRAVPLVSSRLTPRLQSKGCLHRWASHLGEAEGNCLRSFPLLLAMAGAAMLAHILIDALYPWEMPLLWPFSQRTLCWPIIDWGDRAIMFGLVGAMLALGLWRRRTRLVAVVSLLGLIGYVSALALVGPHSS